mmetsp:Transcript_61751/g.169701  ORF Transcript_61751/g.169701 Transcript_61751/m.169701 type:complete len:270 (+) Transcript_61751:419-1228(+)
MPAAARPVPSCGPSWSCRPRRRRRAGRTPCRPLPAGTACASAFTRRPSAARRPRTRRSASSGSRPESPSTGSSQASSSAANAFSAAAFSALSSVAPPPLQPPPPPPEPLPSPPPPADMLPASGILPEPVSPPPCCSLPKLSRRVKTRLTGSSSFFAIWSSGTPNDVKSFTNCDCVTVPFSSPVNSFTFARTRSSYMLLTTVTAFLMSQSATRSSSWTSRLSALSTSSIDSCPLLSASMRPNNASTRCSAVTEPRGLASTLSRVRSSTRT